MIAKPNKTRGRLYLSTILMVLLMLIGTVSEGQNSKCDSIGGATGIDNMPTTASGFIMAGAGMVARTSNTIKLTVPDNAEIKKVLVYWNGIGRKDTDGYDNTITIGGNQVSDSDVINIGQATFFNPTAGWVCSVSYRADVTELNKNKGFIIPGQENNVEVSGLEAFNFCATGCANNGIGILVIYDLPGGAKWPIYLADGNSFLYKTENICGGCHYEQMNGDCGEQSSVAFNLEQENLVDQVPARKASIGMFFASVKGTASNATTVTRGSGLSVRTGNGEYDRDSVFGGACFSNDGANKGYSLDACNEDICPTCFRGASTTLGSTSITYQANNIMGSRDGHEWDTIRSEFYIPPTHNSVTVSALSISIGNNNPASLSWVATVLMIEPLEQLKPKPRAVLVQ